jgi:hypothetical protein
MRCVVLLDHSNDATRAFAALTTTWIVIYRSRATQSDALRRVTNWYAVTKPYTPLSFGGKPRNKRDSMP